MSKKPLKVVAGAPDKPLVIGDIEIPCYVLEDEIRVLSERGMFTGLGASRGGQKIDSVQVPRFMASKTLSPFISRDLMQVLHSRIVFQNPHGGGVAHGYPATILVDICEAMLAARDAGVLQKQQVPIAERCSMLMRGFARIGIIGLVDEATGYQEIRTKNALAKILEKFIHKELQPWTKTFPFEFYEQICRLKGWQAVNAIRRPAVIGHYTNDIVYSRLAPGVFKELKRRNPALPRGGRKNKHHQWFTPEFGHPKLKEHLAAVIALMRASPNWDSFKRHLSRAFPKLGETKPLMPDDE